ncbi:hypothetical protein SGRIM128S_07029 [Streptomyces griseomycini]
MASSRTRRSAYRRKTGEVGRQCWRAPGHSVSPVAVTGRISGWAVVSQGGGEAVAVARSTPTPPSCSRSRTSSSQAKSQASSAGWMRAQEKIPTDTRFTPASRISRTSSSHTVRGHCSGL